MNFLFIALAALVPTIVGFVYYNPNVLGKLWMKHSGMSDEKVKSGNMAVIFGGSLLLSFLLSFILSMLVVHQTDLYSLFNGKEGFEVEGSEVSLAIAEILRLGGDNFMTFGHGAVHGGIIGLFLVFPILATLNFFERRPFMLTVINSLYWIITLALMGGVLCQFGFDTFTL